MSRVNGRRGKTHYSEAIKQRLVDATNQPGASLSKIAQQSGISISTLYKWRQQYQKLTTVSTATLIPIAIQAAEEASVDIKVPVDKSAPEKDSKSAGIIEVILQRARIQICGLVDTELLRAVLKVCQGD
ncbi:MAG: IS66-like element accessory protein TnpA (plasmid) [Candidatus Symbiodolus clandestinus]